MEIGKTKLALTASALAMALMLAGCGGSSSSGGVSSAGGGGGTAPTVTPPTQEELDKAKADAAAAEQAKADAEKEANEAKAELSAAEKAARAEMAKMLFPTIGAANTMSDSSNPVQINHRSGAPAIHPATVGTARVPLTPVKDSEAMLGDWNGMDYSHMAASPKAEIMARVYNNEADATMKPIGDVYDGTSDASTGAGISALNDGVYALATTANHRLEADAFPAKDEGRITYPADTDKRTFDGMFQGAPGKYKCIGDTCTATWTKTGIQLAGTWTFDPNDGAQVTIPDAGYVSFGWWLRKDDQGAPSHVEAFAVPVGNAVALAILPIDGSATYTGKAAGKFAILDNPKGHSNAGHFTADAELTATFDGADGADSSLKGELTGFKANEEDVDWKVTLNKAGWSASQFTGGNTVWTVDGLAGENTGMWDAQAFDENAKDNSNVPTTVTGTFETGFGTTHKMVGAFGATK